MGLSMKSVKNCPCCNKHYFEHGNFYETCPVCDWQDDIVQRMNPDYSVGANKLSLNDYKRLRNSPDFTLTLINSMIYRVNNFLYA